MTSLSPGLAAQRAVHDRCRHPTGVHTPWTPADYEQSIPACFAAVVRRHGARVAVAAGARTLTYAALDRAANRVAHAVLARAADAARPVALLLEDGLDAIIGILGVLKAGRGYVFLDPALPAARLAFMRDDAQAATVVARAAERALAGTLAADVLDLDALPLDARDDPPPADPGPGALFGLIYTSGSTGQPKGAVHDHRNVLSMVGPYSLNLHTSAEDRVALLASFNFNTAVLIAISALMNGAAVHPFDVKREGAARLPAWLAEEGITLYHSVPTLFRQLLDTPPGPPLPALRAVCLGGEAVFRRDVERFRERFGPTCILVHGLGSTELSIVRQFFVDGETPLPDRRIPVGYPIADRDVLILDTAGRPAAPGEAGEMVLRSRYLALGYWRRPEQSREAFLPDPDGGDRRLYRTGDLGVVDTDGCLTHLGRQDAQVKIRGHRIELAEVELTLLELPGVREAAGTARDDAAGGPQLVAYVVPGPGGPPAAAALRAGLAARLPDYMLPAAFVTLAALPLTDTGKVDRLALPPPGRGRPLAEPRVPPRTPVEHALAAVWAEALALDVDAIGIHDDFLALGGDSILAARVLAQVQGLLHAELSPEAFFGAGTIADLALLILEGHPLAGEALEQGSSSAIE